MSPPSLDTGVLAASLAAEPDGFATAAPRAAAHTAGGGWRRLRRHKLALASLAWIALALLAAALAPWISPHDPNAADTALRLAPPGTPGYLLGLDGQGRDILSRIFWGGRESLLSTIVPVGVAVLLSLALGLFAGYSRGRASALAMRVVDVLFAFPMVLLAIGLATALGPGLWTVALTIVFAATPYLTRVVYAGTRAERDKDYVEAARSLGATHAQILLREILPNVAAPVLVYGTTLVGSMIVFLSGLSFLGLGTQPPTADWGRMVSEGAQVLVLDAAHVATAPALAIVSVALAFNWLGNGLRDLLDPQ
ncbi:ABC transporter permease [Variovorax sp.]|jgi:ABC-type dipeptide/oligopeptide/nickel transport system permease subunit|uniref:ABC transporter permease n=1 Tax=Variovorax TaxID=34072 RepID=UPI001385B2F9|nr:ABC transporter permease [Variovorax sp.]KAF1067397.1 MAG: Glutathione transport system permease protein GsiD [Variovorax sp.]